MPGRSLNDTERRLAKWWNNAAAFPYPVLAGLSIESDQGLRGICSLELRFDYPLTVLCGKNGVGKTTVLALAALAFHSPPNHFPANARRRSRNNDRSYYTFSDFFFKGPDDPDITGVEIKWQYRGATNREITVKKRSDKWMHYERRPQRPVHFLGVTRAVPAIEQSPLRTHFRIRTPQHPQGPQLNEAFRRRLADIMGHPYKDAYARSSARYFLRGCVAGARYSGFNMGCGEDILIDLLLRLQDIPEGSMVVIEEIELGLHPEALTRLAQHLQEIMLEKKLQVVVSTHSQHLLDAVPKDARVLLRREGDKLIAIYSPTTEFAVGAMSADARPELVILCEDKISELLIKASLPLELRRRVQITPVGSWSELARVAFWLIRAVQGSRVLIIADGGHDPSPFLRNCEEARQMLGTDSDRLNWSTLPGEDPPERWIVNELRQDNEGAQLLATELRVSQDMAKEYLDEMVATSDPHDCFHRLAQKLGIPEDEIKDALVRAVSAHPKHLLAHVRSAIEAVLNGEKIP